MYTYHREVARLALREDHSMWDTLQLKGPRKKAIPQWLAQVQAFYNNIGRVAAQMEHRGVTEAELMQTKEMVEASAAIRIRQAYNKSKKESAVEQKKKLLHELQEWIRIYDYIAKVALKDNAQQLEA